MAPKVTVIHTCYNHKNFLVQSLESVRKQSFQDFEWIIIDDLSTDGSAQMIADWIEENGVECTFIAHKKNIGFCATLNEAISLAKGEYISYFSTDDIMLPDKLQSQVDILDDGGEKVGVVYCNAHQIDDDGELLDETFFDTYRRIEPPPSGDVFSTLLEWNFIPAPSTMIRRSCYEKVGGYDERLTLEDWDMWIRIARYYDFAFCPYMGIYYRQHRNNTLKHLDQKVERHQWNTFLTFEKIINSVPMTRAELKWPKRRVKRSAFHLCRVLAPNRRELLWRAFRCTRSFQTLALLGIHFISPGKVEAFFLNAILKTTKKLRLIPQPKTS